jgi:hypothetical protein
MTRDEFIDGYCERSHINRAELNKWRVALPCACGESACEGWAMVSRDPDLMKDHLKAYANAVEVRSTKEEQ